MMEEWGTSWSITLVGLRKEGLDCPKKKNVSVCFFKVDRIAKLFSSLIARVTAKCAWYALLPDNIERTMRVPEFEDQM